MKIKRIYILTISFLFISIQLSAQKIHICKEFKKLSRPEKCWAIKHPFIAKKAFLMTQIVRKATDSIKKTNTLDEDANGGQVDAFRHSYWMALLSYKFNWRKAYHLGKAHEKGNYIDYRKHRLEEGSIPDKISSDMDMCNNMSGIEVGREFKVPGFRFQVSKPQLNPLDIEKEIKLGMQKAVIDSILKGKMVVIKKDNTGRFLDEKGNIIISDSIKGKWKNPKCLVPSNFSR